MRVRFFNTYEPVSTHYRDLVPYLATHGADVEVVVSAAEYRRGRNLRAFLAQQPNVRLIEAPCWGLSVDQGALAKAIITITYLVVACLVGLFGRQVDKNVFMTQPPLIALLGNVLKTVRRQPYVCVVMDLYPQIAVAMGLLSPKAFYYGWLKRSAINTLKNAAHVIVIGRCMRQRLIQEGVTADQIEYIPNWADTDTIVPVDHSENLLCRDMGWQDKFVVLYAGNLGIPQYFDDLLDAASALRDEPAIQFALIGNGSQEQEIMRKIGERKLTNVAVHPFLHEQYPLAAILSAANLHFVTLRHGIEGLAVPSKTYGILAAGRPILYQGEPSGEIARMIDEEEIGEVVLIGESHQLQRAIMESYCNPQKRLTQQAKARELAISKYSSRHALQKYSTLLQGPVLKVEQVRQPVN